jgi:hypothetical protein
MAIYRLLNGQHHTTEVVGKTKNDAPITEEKSYRPGDLIDTEEDLLRYNGALGMSPKFEKVGESKPKPRFQSPSRDPNFQAQERAPSTSSTSPRAAAGIEGDTGGVEQPAPSPTTTSSNMPPAEVSDEDFDEEVQEPTTEQLQGDGGQQSDPNAAYQTPKQGQPPKESSTPPQPRQKTLDEEYGPLEKLTVSQLQDIADEEEIELKGASKKDDIIRNLRAAKR